MHWTLACMSVDLWESSTCRPRHCEGPCLNKSWSAPHPSSGRGPLPATHQHELTTWLMAGDAAFTLTKRSCFQVRWTRRSSPRGVFQWLQSSQHATPLSSSSTDESHWGPTRQQTGRTFGLETSGQFHLVCPALNCTSDWPAQELHERRREHLGWKPAPSPNTSAELLKDSLETFLRGQENNSFPASFAAHIELVRHSVNPGTGE